MSPRTETAVAPSDLLEYLGSSDDAFELVDDIDWTRLPRHIAVIMDGNGRWASRHGFKERIRGHEAGTEAVRATTRTC